MGKKTKYMTSVAMLVAMAYVLVTFARIPVVLFLKYDPKDIVITLGGLIWGPLTAALVSVIVSLLEMITVSGTGPWGLIMNVISTCSFACVASFVYKRKRTLSGAVIGLLAGVASMVVVMLFWNYLITPIYMGYPREAVAKLLLPAFLPFNLIKAGLNAALTFLLYKPVMTALRRARFVQASPIESGQKTRPIVLWIICAAIIVGCVLAILFMKNILSF